MKTIYTSFLLLILVISCKSTKTNQQELTPEKIIREKYGMVVSDLDDAIKQSTGLSNGVFVVNVFPNYPAQKAGIKKGDIITIFDNKPVLNLEEFNQLVKEYTFNYDEVTLHIFRDNKTERIKLYMF